MTRRTRILTLPLLAASWLAAAPAAGIERPPGRYSPGVAYDEARHEIVMFGGFLNGGVLDDLWIWNGTDWRQETAPGPSARSGVALAYDPIRHRVVLFGGDRLNAYFRETWEWDGTSWRRASLSGPPARTLARLVWDPGRGKLLLFGGYSGTAVLGDLWEWDGSHWTQVSNAGPARFLHGAAFEPATSRLVVFGGNTSAISPFGNELAGTWAWSGAWDSLETVGPSRRDHVAIAHDPLRGRTVLYGGARTDTLFADLWELSGDAWTNAPFTGGPGIRVNPQLVFADSAIVLYGGFDSVEPRNDLWAWDGDTWTRLDDDANATLLARFDIEPSADGLWVRWALSATSPLAAITIERAEDDAGPWLARGTQAGAELAGELLDREVDPGHTYAYRLTATSEDGTRTTFGPVRGTFEAGERVTLSLAPNPTRDRVTLAFELPRRAPAKIDALDAHGRVIATLVDATLEAGPHTASWNAGRGTRLAAGLYFIRLESLGTTRTRRLAIVR